MRNLSVNLTAFESLFKPTTRIGGAARAVMPLAPLAIVLSLMVSGTVLAEGGAGDEPRARGLRSSKEQIKDPILSEKLSRELFLAGKREQACQLLLASHGATQNPEQKKLLEERIRVVSRSFLLTDSSRYYQAGLNALTEGKLAAAEDRFTGVLGKEPGLFDVLVRRAQVRWLQGNGDGALEDLRLAISLNPFEPESQVWLGLVLLGRGERAQGVFQILGAINQLPRAERARPFVRGCEWVVLWASGQQETLRRQVRAWLRAERSQKKSGPKAEPVPSWAWSMILKVPAPEGGLREALKKTLERWPTRKVDVDGGSGLSLQWWEPGGLAQYLEGPTVKAGG